MAEAEVWELIDLNFDDGIISIDYATAGQANFSYLTYSLTFKRKPTPYIYDIFLPCSTLMILLLATFAIPSHHPERPAISVTIVLAFYIVQSLVNESIPKTSVTLPINVYVYAQIVICSVVSIYLAAACHLSTAKLPNNLNKTVIDRAACLVTFWAVAGVNAGMFASVLL